MTRTMNRPLAIAALALAAGLLACDKNAVQQLPLAPVPSARIMFFNYGVGDPQVNFYANETKMTAISSATGTESTNGVAYGAVGNGGLYSALEPGAYSLTGRIAATTDKNLPIDTLNATIADGKFYSFFLTGFYNTTAKKADAFIVEDPIPAPLDYTVAYVRLVHASPNADPLTLYSRLNGDTVTAHWTAVGTAVAYKGAGAFATITPGVYDFGARYTAGTTNRITVTGVSLVYGHVYTIGARGDTTVTSSTDAKRPLLSSTTNW